MWVEKHGRVYRIRDRVAGKVTTVKGGYPNKTAAKAALVLEKGDKMRGDQLVPGGGRMVLRDWVAIWRPAWEASLKPSSRESESRRVDNHILPLLGDHPLEDIDALVIQTWVARLLRGDGPMGSDKAKRRPLSPKTIRSCHGVLHTIFKAATTPTYRLIRANPCAATVLPRWQKKEMRFLTDPEIGRLIAAMPEHWRPLVLLLVATGLRWGEATGLRVGDVDLLAKVPVLRVTRALHELGGSGELVFTDPKTRQSRRTVSFTTKVAAALAGLVAGRGREELLFLTPTGLTVRTRNFRRTWQKALKRAGLEGLRVHDLRHTHAAMLISAGRSLTAIQRRLGHSSIAVTSDLYGHLREEVDEGILAAVEAALAGVDLDALSAEVEDELVDALV
jgi:integrase